VIEQAPEIKYPGPITGYGVYSGRSREEATAVADRELGNVALMKEKTRDAWGWRWLEDLTVDLRFGVRMLRKNLVLTLAAILTLALGIGANSAIFTLLYGWLQTLQR
jgi:hypothetical protein